MLFRVVNSSYECLAVERTTALAVQTVGVIEQAAKDCIKTILGPALEADVQVWEVRPVVFPVERPLIRVAPTTLRA